MSYTFTPIRTISNTNFTPLCSQAIDGFLFVLNFDGRVESVSPNIVQYLNYSPSDVIGKDIYNIVHHGDHQSFIPSLSPMSVGWYMFLSLRIYETSFYFFCVSCVEKEREKNSKKASDFSTCFTQPSKELIQPLSRFGGFSFFNSCRLLQLRDVSLFGGWS